jgi:hypothetical protein
MTESLGKTLMFTVFGIVLGSVLGPLAGFLGQTGLVNFHIYAGIGFAAIIGAVVCGIMGLASNQIGGLITGLMLGIAVGGVVDYVGHPPVNPLWGFAVGAGLGFLGGLVAGVLAPPETQLKK